MAGFHFVVGNCGPAHRFFGKFYNARVYYESSVFLGTEAEVNAYYSTVV